MSTHTYLMDKRLAAAVAALEAAGHTPAHLDEAVQDAASELATAANNGGLREQVSFLLAAGDWKPADIVFAAEQARARQGQPRYPEFGRLAALLQREGVPPETEITFTEDSSADNRYALRVVAEDAPGLARKLAAFWGCPQADLPLHLAVNLEATDDWHGRGEGDLRAFGDELGEWDEPFFDRSLTVAEIHAIAQAST